jgi:hypothetical protein
VQAPQQSAPRPPARSGSQAAGGGKSGKNGSTEAAGKGAKGKHKGGNGPSEAPPGAANGVAGAPQSLAAAGETLASLLGQSQVSAQALAFYRIPLFLLPIYQAAAAQYGVPWQILAAINEVETDYGNDQSVSSAGAVGWMQFMPETWLQYGVDALNAGYADPYNPVDAIFAAARYLHAAGASQSLRRAILAYNHSEAYAESVLLRAKLISAYPQSIIAVLTGLTQGELPVGGAHVGSYLSISRAAGVGASTTEKPPLAAASATAGAAALGIDAPAPGVAAAARTGANAPTPDVAAKAVKAHTGETLRFVDIVGSAGAPVTAVADGRIVGLGHSHRLGSYLDLQDIYGDVFTYAGLGSIAPRYRVSLPHTAAAQQGAAGDKGAGHDSAAGHEGSGPEAAHEASNHEASNHEAVPTPPVAGVRHAPLTLQVKTPIGRTAAAAASSAAAKTAAADAAAADAQTSPEEGPPPAGMGRRRLYATPDNPVARVAATRRSAAQSTPHSGRWLPLRLGSVVSQGTVLGHLSGHALGAGLATSLTPSARMRFAIRPAGDSTTIDPRPIIANWRQLDGALHPKGAKGTVDLVGATVSQVFLMSQSELERTVLSDPGIALSRCARQDVAAGAVDGRVLAVLAFLARSGLRPTVEGLRCPSGASGAGARNAAAGARGAAAGAFGTGNSVSAAASAGARGLAAAEHRSGAAVDISAINGIPIAGHQGNGSITDATIRALLTLKGRFAPQQIVSLMYYPGTANTLASASRWNGIHISFRPIAATAASASSSAFTHKAHSAGPGRTAPSPLVSAGVIPTSVSSPVLTDDLSTAQWNQLIARIGALPAPSVARKPTSSAIRDPQAAAGNGGLGAGTLPAAGSEEAAGGEEG